MIPSRAGSHTTRIWGQGGEPSGWARAHGTPEPWLSGSSPPVIPPAGRTDEASPQRSHKPRRTCSLVSPPLSFIRKGSQSLSPHSLWFPWTRIQGCELCRLVSLWAPWEGSPARSSLMCPHSCHFTWSAPARCAGVGVPRAHLASGALAVLQLRWKLHPTTPSHP